MKSFFLFAAALFAFGAGLFFAGVARANIPGGGNGTGPNVTVTDNGNGTVTMANGIVSLLITKNGATINQINYTYNNGGGTQTQQLLAGGKDGGEFYWEFGGWGGSSWAYSLATNSGSYAEIDLFCDSATNGTVDVHYSLLRGSPGFYVTPIWSHRPQDGAFGTGEERDNIYIAPYFNWMSVNDQVQREEGLNSTYAVSDYSPQENSLVTSGPDQGTYEDKYKWSADFGVERVWGWSSVSDAAYGVTGQNLGIWHVVASSEFYNGGPLKPELNDAPMVNMINGGHYYFGNDSGFADGETWTRVSGPYFIYINNVTNTLTDPVQTSQALYADAKEQAAAEAPAWPYSWMNNTNYASAAQRGTVAGQIVINDTYNPSASASNLWVGVVQQPAVTLNNVYDFQLWEKPYQFWTKSDANGSFVISNVIAGNNYTLYAFGPGAEGMFMSKNQTGGYPGIIYNLPATPFTVVVTGGTTNSLGPVTWTPTRVGPTVFEIGYPDRKGDKFRHGDDYWVGDVGPSPTAPSPVWDKFMEFPYDFPNGLNYVVGQNHWNTDWNYVQSVYPDFYGNNANTSSTITFNLAANPGSATASLLMGIASDDNTPIYVTVNGTLLTSANCSGTPQTALPTTGWFPNNDISDSNIREENHGGYSDERLTFSGSLLTTNGSNTINFSFRQAGGSGFTHHFMYDYIRLELTGYVPPAPTSVTAYAGNNCVLLSWPVVAGATSYNLLRSTTSGSGYVAITNGVVGPVCGSGPANATFVDSSAVNGTTYYYVVRSVNPVNASTNSPPSSGVTPASGISSSAAATPTGLMVTSTNNAVIFTWNAVPGANFYTVYRGTVVNRLGYVPLYTILSDTTTSATYTDATGTLGCTYSYYVTATSAGGTSSNSIAVTAKPVPPPPATAPGNVQLTDTITSSNQTATISWSAVSGAVGYILYRANSPTGPFSFPGNYVQSVTTGSYTDGDLATNTLFTYMVVAMNAGGVSTNSLIVSTPPAAPASLNAYAGNAQITLSWSASVGATNYVILRGTNSGGEITIGSSSNTTFTDTGLLNGTNYFYIVQAVGPGGSSLYSPEASTAPFSGPPPIYWINAITASAQGWNVNSNWSNGTAFPNATQAVAIVNAPIGTGQTINLNQAITVGAISLGASGGAFNVTGNGAALTFDNTPGLASLVQLSTSKGDTISAPMIINGGLSVSNATANYLTLAGTISGATNGLATIGNVILNGTNTYIGGTTINSGTVQLNVNELNNSGVGTGAITFQGGTLQLNGYAGNNGTYWGTLPNNLIVPAGQKGTLLCPARIAGNGLTGTLTGDGTLNVTVDYVRGLLSGDWSAFTGQINVSPRSGTADFRIYNAYGYANAAIYLNNGVTFDNVNASGQTTDIGELGGASGAYIGAGNGASANPTWRIGAINTTNTYAGVIANSGVTSLVKIGTGTFILTGTNNSYTGSTTISGGTLLVNNTNGSATGYGTVIVNSGGTLGGNGIISGAVAVNSGGTLAPGNPLGQLTLSNNLTLAAGSTTLVQVQHSPFTNDTVKILGALTEGGTLSANNSGMAAFTAGDSFKLFSAASYTGAFSSFTLPALNPGLFWSTSRLRVDGSLAVVSSNSPSTSAAVLTGTNLVWRGSGGTPNWYYTILSATNLTLPLNQWTVTVSNRFDGGGNFSWTNAALPNTPPRFYRLQVQ